MIANSGNIIERTSRSQYERQGWQDGSYFWGFSMEGESDEKMMGTLKQHTIDLRLEASRDLTEDMKRIEGRVGG